METKNNKDYDMLSSIMNDFKEQTQDQEQEPEINEEPSDEFVDSNLEEFDDDLV